MRALLLMRGRVSKRAVMGYALNVEYFGSVFLDIRYFWFGLYILNT